MPGTTRRQDRKELKKHSASIQIQNNIDLLQRKTWNVLLWNAYNDLKTQDIHSISVQEIARLVGYDSKDEKHLKEATKAMLHCIVEWDILDKDGAPVWGAAVLLASVQITNGVCSYGFAPHLREKLYNPAMYARLDLDLQKRFGSKHSLALWELCTDYLGAKRDCGETPWIPLGDFRRLMGIGAEQYGLYKLFSQRVIAPSLAEINRVSDFRVTLEHQRRGRKITALKFKMIRRTALLPEPDGAPLLPFPELDDGAPPLVRELRNAGLSAQDALDIWQQGFGFVEAAARPAVADMEAEAAFARYVREKIHLLQRQQAAGKVQNGTGFLREALKKNYANPEFAVAEQARAATAARQTHRQREARRNVLEAQRMALRRACDDAVDGALLQLADTAPDLVEIAVSKALADTPVLRQLCDRGAGALDKYRASLSLRAVVKPRLTRYVKASLQAIEAQYAPELAALDAQIAAL